MALAGPAAVWVASGHREAWELMSINTGIPVNTNVTSTRPSPYPSTSNPSYLNATPSPPPGFKSSPTLPNSTTHQSTTNYLLPPTGLPSCPTQTNQPDTVPTTSALNSDSSIFFRATEGPQVPIITNDGNAELSIKSCNEAGVAPNSQIQPHFLNVKPAKPSSSDDCYCFILNKTKRKIYY